MRLSLHSFAAVGVTVTCEGTGQGIVKPITAEVHQAAGSEENWRAISAWATSNLTPAATQSIDAYIRGADPVAGAFAVATPARHTNAPSARRAHW
jgi:hypothetical protein